MTSSVLSLSRPINFESEILTWNDGTIPKLAQSIYDDLAFDRIPILADALEEAGCHNQEILRPLPRARTARKRMLGRGHPARERLMPAQNSSEGQPNVARTRDTVVSGVVLTS